MTRICVLVNYSSIKLTESMTRLLNMGLKFSVLPHKLDLTEVLVDFKRFERSVIWHEFWAEIEDKADYEKPIFKSQKFNLPKNHTIPQGIKTFLGAMKSELMDHRNRNQVESNLPHDEMEVIKTLVRLQRERIIIIKPCDKGAGVMIMDFKDYMRACYDHLLSRVDNVGPPQYYYKQVDLLYLERAKCEINEVLIEARSLEIITEQEFKAMTPDDCEAARFYCNFKVHKPHLPGKPPPVRPIISGLGSITEGVGQFVDHHIKEVATKHPSFLQDTPHFLRAIEVIRRIEKLPSNAILVTADIKAAYQNIPQDDGVDCLYEALEERDNKDVPSELLSKLMELILKSNLFEFDKEIYQQLIGTAMGSKPAPNYANIYIARRLDRIIRNLGEKYGTDGKSSLIMLKRFLDDIFSIFFGTTKQLHKLFKEINEIHLTLKFTFEHTNPDGELIEDRCDCNIKQSIPFLDTRCSIVEGKI